VIDKRRQSKSPVVSTVSKRLQHGKIKGQACMNGEPQRGYIPKEDAASPTILTESVFITLAITASERRHLRCYNGLSAFVNTDVDMNVLMVLKGELAEMMVHFALQIYQKHIMADKKESDVLYVKLQKVIY
jgi:hypothetical protein